MTFFNIGATINLTEDAGFDRRITMASSKLHLRDVARIFNKLDIGILLADGEGTVIWGNDYYSYLAGFDIKTYFGDNVRNISGRQDISMPREKLMIDYVMEHRRTETEVVRYHINDYVITTATPVFSEDDPEVMDYIIYVMTNFTALNRLQENLERSTAQINALRDHLRTMQMQNSLGDHIIISSKEMYNVYEKAQRLAGTNVSVMITGESGCGKDVLARYIHEHSSRSEENFIHVNMAAIPKTLFESELFGYAPGAFSGASKSGKDGLVQLADKGTLFLDEIGELPLDIQVKLLHVIQNKEVRAIGAVETTHVDFRIICATNRDLKEMVNLGQFRLDLYYRLNTIELYLPPLRERREEIPPLTRAFLKRFNDQNQSNKVIAPNVIQAFRSYDWPGNVRELLHTVESIYALCSGEIITSDLLPPEFQTLKDSKIPAGQASVISGNLKDAVQEFEKGLIRSALDRCPSALEAAHELGIDASTLSKKRKRYGL